MSIDIKQGADRILARPALSATRTMDIIDLFTAFPGRAFSMSEIMRATDINVASCHAVLNALARRGYLIKRERSYVLGPALIAAGHAALEAQPIVARATKAAQALNADLGLPVLLSTLAADDVLALASFPDAAGRLSSIRPGQRMPLIPPVGVHFLAWASEASIEAWIGRAATSEAHEIAAWRAALAITHARGYQVTLRSERRTEFADLMRTMAAGTQTLEYHRSAAHLIADHGWTLEQPETIDPKASYDVVLIAAPIFDRDGHAMLSLGFGGFAEKLSGARITTLAERLMEACLQVMREQRSGKPDRS